MECDSYYGYIYIYINNTVKYYNLISTLLILSILVGCAGDTKDLDEQSTTTKTVSGSAAAKEKGIDFKQGEPTGDTISETFPVIGSEPRGKYTSVTTLLIVSPDLSNDVHETDRRAFHSALSHYTNTLVSRSLGTASNISNHQNNVYCFDFDYTIYSPDQVHPTRPCRFLHSHLTPSEQLRKHATQLSRNTSAVRYFLNDKVIEKLHLHTVLNTLKYYDKENLNRSRIPPIFKTSNATSTLKVLLQVAYDVDTDMSLQIITGRLEEIYGAAALKSFMFFALQDEPQTSRDNYQAIADKFRGQTYTVLGTTAADEPGSHVTIAMDHISRLVAGQAKGRQFTTQNPIAKIKTITVGSSKLKEKDYAFRGSTLFILKDLFGHDTITVDYITQEP